MHCRSLVGLASHSGKKHAGETRPGPDHFSVRSACRGPRASRPPDHPPSSTAESPTPDLAPHLRHLVCAPPRSLPSIRCEPPYPFLIESPPPIHPAGPSMLHPTSRNPFPFPFPSPSIPNPKPPGSYPSPSPPISPQAISPQAIPHPTHPLNGVPPRPTYPVPSPSPPISPQAIAHPTHPLKRSRRGPPAPSPGALDTTRFSLRFGARVKRVRDERERERGGGRVSGQREKEGGPDATPEPGGAEGKGGGTGECRPAYTCVAVEG